MIFIDGNIFMYAAGKSHPHKKRCLSLLQRVARAPSAHRHCINTAILQEILHREIDTVVSYDRDFSTYPGIRRVEP